MNGDIIEYNVDNKFKDILLVKWGKVEFSILKKHSREILRNGRHIETKITWERGTYQGIYKYGTVIGNIYDNPELLEVSQ